MSLETIKAKLNEWKKELTPGTFLGRRALSLIHI